MSSLHATLTALTDALVRDLLRVVRESSIAELAGVQSRPTSPRAPTADGPVTRPRRRNPRRDAGETAALKSTERHRERVTPEQKPLRPRRPTELPPPRASDSAPHITDPGALLREPALTGDVADDGQRASLEGRSLPPLASTASAVGVLGVGVDAAPAIPLPHPTDAESPAVAAAAEVLRAPTLRQGEVLLRTPSGHAVLRRRRGT